MAQLDARVKALVGSSEEPVLIQIDEAIELLELAYKNLEFDDSTDDDRKAHVVALEHLSRTSRKPSLKGKVWFLAARERNVARYREEGVDSPTLQTQSNRRMSHVQRPRTSQFSCSFVRTATKPRDGEACLFGGL